MINLQNKRITIKLFFL